MGKVPPRSPAGKKNRSGIEVDSEPQDFGVTATVLLSRSGMGMMQRKKADEPPISAPADASAKIIYSVATDTDIGCPKCRVRFEISKEFYGAVAECPECACEFLIKPPGTPPYRPPKPRPKRPAPKRPAPPGRKAPTTQQAPSTPQRQPTVQAKNTQVQASQSDEYEEYEDEDEEESVRTRDPLVVVLLASVCILLLILIIVIAI